jgi:hypothetical protein
MNRMIEAEFDVLCANDKDACERVKKTMGDFKLLSAKKTDSFDHKGIRQFSSVKEILQRVDEIRSKNHEDLIDIEIVIKK